MNSISLIFTYYKNPLMLAYQWNIWKTYPADVEIVLVDDASPIGLRAEEIVASLERLTCKFKLYRILTDVAWNQRGAHNLGIKHASHPWIMFVDIDHVVTLEVVKQLQVAALDSNTAYSLSRIKHASRQPYHPHKETRLMASELFWNVGGFDESFCGCYANAEREWDKRLRLFKNELLPFQLELVLNTDISDSRTTGVIRKEGRDEEFYADVLNWKSANSVPIQLFRLPWKCVVSNP